RTDEGVSDALGEGRRAILTGRSGTLVKRVSITAYAARPRFLFVQVRYTNEGPQPVSVLGFASHHYALAPGAGKEPAFWSYQPGSYEKRPDWILPVPRGFTQRNFLGMNDSDYGGGTPVLDVWRRDVGLAIGHIELVPKQVSLPVRRRSDGVVEVALTGDVARTLKPGESFSTPRTFVAVHRGDHF